MWTCLQSHLQYQWINPVKLQPTDLSEKNPGVLMAGVTPRLRGDNGGTTYLHPSHYCLTECFPKSHRSDRITPKFAAPSACLSNTNRGLFFFFYRFVFVSYRLHWSYRPSALHPTRCFDFIVLFVGSEQLLKPGN